MFNVIPGNPGELHRYLITRFLASGVAISLLVGALVYYWESWRVEMRAFELAVVSAKHFDSPAMRKLLAAGGRRIIRSLLTNWRNPDLSAFVFSISPGKC